MIVKDDSEEKMLDRCLASIAPYVDGIYLTITNKPNVKLQAVAKKYGANVDMRVGEFKEEITQKHVKWLKKFLGYKPEVKEGEGIFLFDKARNANLKFIPDEYRWFLWIDVDDVLRNGKMLKECLADADAQGATAIFLNYLYQVEMEGDKIKNVIIQHLREQLVRIDGKHRDVYKWEGAIHETLIQQTETKKIAEPRIDRLHFSTNERFGKAMVRNMKTLEREIYRTKGADPRPIYYLGKSYYDVHSEDARAKAEKLILMYLSPEMHKRNMSGWREERSQGWEYLGEVYREKGEHQNSIKCFANALIEAPQNRSIFFNLGISYVIKRDFETARFWAVLGSKVPHAKSTLANNPRDTESRFYEVIYNCGVNLGRLDESWAAMEKLIEMYPEKPHIKEQWGFINELKKEKEVTTAFGRLVNYLNTTGEAKKIRALLAATPKKLADNPVIIKLYHQIFPAKDWGKDEIALYCGPQFTSWGPKSLHGGDKSFVGGSEEAVIYLARELVKQGWKVTVYADPGEQKGKHDGVVYEPHFNFNIKDKFNVLIYWRSPGYSDMKCDAKKTYLWCHDVQNPADYTKERLNEFTKLIVLSEAHRENLPDIPDKKFLVSTNGYFEHSPKSKPKRVPRSMIWTSSYDRGLEHLLKMWPGIRKEVPDATLNVFYGWKLFTNFYLTNPERMAWKGKIDKLMKQPGITHHGRVIHPEIEEWYKKSAIWAYPTHFYEINCISAIKAQLWGAVPVCIDYAALNQTVKYGKKIEGDIWDPDVADKFKKELIKALKDERWQGEQRKLMGPWSRKKFAWSEIAKQWIKEFKK